jgi:hypothetical protein
MAAAAPMPLLPPVTKMFFPSKRFMMFPSVVSLMSYGVFNPTAGLMNEVSCDWLAGRRHNLDELVRNYRIC